MEKLTAENFIEKLNLNKHPEGGYFFENYRSSIFYNEKNLTTSIFFLLNENDISRFHSLKSDEIWYYHFGSSVKIILIDKQGRLSEKILGINLHKNENPSVIIEAGNIFAAELMDKSSFCFVSCVVSPGFSFEDFKLYNYGELTALYPDYSEIIKKFT
ncbi:MAG: cupin domain-containing protein [Spirochaetes bacterium]|nr:cupin domain-containing protein [Spirochaetota bacterium]